MSVRCGCTRLTLMSNCIQAYNLNWICRLLPTGLYASPRYQAEHGEPQAPQDLPQHRAVRLLSGNGEPEPMVLHHGDARWEGLPSTRVTANAPEYLIRIIGAGALAPSACGGAAHRSTGEECAGSWPRHSFGAGAAAGDPERDQARHGGDHGAIATGVGQHRRIDLLELYPVYRQTAGNEGKQRALPRSFAVGALKVDQLIELALKEMVPAVPQG